MNSPYYARKILGELSSDPKGALEKLSAILVSDITEVQLQENLGGDDCSTEKYRSFLEGYGLLHELMEQSKELVGFSVLDANVNFARTENINSIRVYAQSILDEIEAQRVAAAISRGRRALADQFDPPPVYEFSDSDCSRIKALVEDLGSLIRSTDDLDDSHKARLLKRLNSLRTEINRSVSNLDKMWGVAAEVWMTAKVVLSNPEKANEWMTVLAKLIGIIAAAQAVAHGLPASELPKFLPWPGSDK